MMKQLSLVTGRLQPGDRYADWNYIFDGDEVPLASTQTSMADGVEVFSIDFKRLRPIQQERLLETMVKRLDITRAEAFKRLRQGLFQIRAEDVRLMKTQRNFL